MSDKLNDIIYGKDKTTRVVSVEPEADHCVIFRELEDGTIEKETVDNSLYILYKKKYSDKFKTLKGQQPFKYVYITKDLDRYKKALKFNYEERRKFHVIRDLKEAFMIRKGVTYFKGMKPNEVSMLSFDLEHTYGIGEQPDVKGSLLIISNTFRKNGVLTKKLFCIDDYKTGVLAESMMVCDWVEWVKSLDPSIVLGHNIFGHDFQILKHVAEKHDIKLKLGRNNSALHFNKHNSQKRKDGSQSYDYQNCFIYGREIVDTYFVALDYDIGRNYENYGLKQIIKQEGLEKKDRQHYDASQIKKDWNDLEKRKKIKQYAQDDSEDCIKLFDLMASSRFYYAQSIPRSFQQIMNTASGSQLNSLMVRAYLQDGHSVAEGDEKGEFEGAISFAVPGIHKNVYKIDVASLYPSIMREFKIYSPEKDPEKYLLKIVEYFTIERLKNKKLGKETGDRYYKDLEQAQKIVINSLYGFLGAPKLNYNYPDGASSVTRNGREILTKAMEWAKEKEFKLSIVDTDSIAFTKKDSKAFTEEETKSLLSEINSKMPALIRWEDDGLFKTIIAVRTKNYVLQGMDKKVKIKGSGLKATMKEKALKKYITEVIDYMLKGRKDLLYDHYMTYIETIKDIKDISQWCSKKTYTKSVMTSERTNETRVKDATTDEDMNEGDKFYVYFKTKTEIALEKNFDGTYHKPTLFKKLYKTLCIFENIIDVDLFPDFSLKRNETR